MVSSKLNFSDNFGSESIDIMNKMSGDFRCECQEGFNGPRCETTSIAMDGEGYAWYPSLTVCENSVLEVQFMTVTTDGLIFYNGPITTSALGVTGKLPHE
jgi:hypothetical protein